MPTVVEAQEDVVTQRAYVDTTAPRAYITSSPRTVLQRLSLPAQAVLSRVYLELSGPIAERAGMLAVYGHEGGLLAPRIGRLLASMPIRKSTIGRERVSVDVQPAVLHSGGQIFVGITDVAFGVRVLLVDDRTQEPCIDDAGMRGPTVFSSDSMQWLQTSMPMAMAVSYDVPERVQGEMFMRDTTVDAVADRPRSAVAYVTSGDIDGDGFVEVACAGVLFKNERGRLQAIDMQDSVSYPLMYFVDVDGDGRDEVVTTDIDGGGSLALWQWHGRKMSLLSRSTVLVPGRIVSMATLSEGFGAVTAAVVEHPTGSHVYMLRWSSAGVVSLEAFDHPSNDGVASVLAADLTGDGRRELLLRRSQSDVVLAGTASGGFDVLAERVAQDSSLVTSSASIVANALRGADLMVPTAVKWQRAAHRQAPMAVRLDERVLTLFDELPDWDERPSAVIDADMTGDGARERLVFGEGRCRALRVFARNGETWADVTYRLGLDELHGAADGLVLDVDNDGCSELLVDRNGGFEVYRRSCNASRLPLTQQVIGGNGSSGSGFDGGQLSYGRGRGRLIQEPTRAVLRTAQIAQDPNVLVVRGDASGWYIDGISGATEIDVVMTTLAGSVVYSGRMPVEGSTARLQLPATDLASGTYSIVVTAGKNIINHVIHLLK